MIKAAALSRMFLVGFCHCSVSSGSCLGTESVLWARGNVPGTAGILQLELGLAFALHTVPSALLQVRKCWPDWIYYCCIYGFLLPHFKSNVLCPTREASEPHSHPPYPAKDKFKTWGQMFHKTLPNPLQIPCITLTCIPQLQSIPTPKL